MSKEHIIITGDFCPIGALIENAVTTLRPFNELHGILGDEAAIISNLECPLTSRTRGRPFKWANLKGDPSVVPILDGLTMAILANNHITDFGIEGARDTMVLLDKLGISHVGYGNNIADATRPALNDIGHSRLGVVALACPTTNGENLATHSTEGVAPLGMDILKHAVQSARQQCDVLLVYLHWGCEWMHDPVSDQLRLARLAIVCGADAVVGCHSHTIQSYEQYNGRWIFYGLGNFLFGTGVAQEVSPDGAIVEHPLRLERENRESLAVVFSIQADSVNGRLKLEKIQPMSFNEHFCLKPSGVENLTFNLTKANDRLSRYTKQNAAMLECTQEPRFFSKFRNGILAYWYNEEPIGESKGWVHSSRFWNALRRFLSRSISRVRRL
jgi:hypothetical protein